MEELTIISKWLYEHGFAQKEFVIHRDNRGDYRVWTKPNVIMFEEGIHLISVKPMIKLYLTDKCCLP